MVKSIVSPDLFNLEAQMKKQPYRNAKYNPQRVLDLLWAIRLNDKFYFDTYGKMWQQEKFKDHWQMEKMKPYDLPEGIELEIQELETNETRFSDGGGYRQKFAFIKKQQPEHNDKNKFIKDVVQQVYGARADAGDSSLSLISDFEIWLIKYMENFRIERIK